jgi:CubicO group peptidase (beta-lactamase class C family)
MVHGEVAAGFEAVREELERVLAGQGGGASLCAIVDDRVVCDLWGGTVGERSLVHTWSVVKPVTAACLLLLVERGRVALADPVEAIWPELIVAEDSRLTVGDILGHRAGLVTVPGGSVAGLTSWDRTCRAIEVLAPAWEPGQAHGEHALTYGHLVGELVRRIDGRTIGQLLAEELAGPLDLDVHVGLTIADQARVADLEGPLAPWWRELAGPPGTLRHAALGELDAPLGPTGEGKELINSDVWRAAEVPAVNGHATARALARFWHLQLTGALPVDLLQAPRTGPDLVLGREVTWTVGSVQVDGDDIGMGGVGGSYAGLRPSASLAWAFLTTVMADHDRAERLETAILRAVAAR